MAGPTIEGSETRFDDAPPERELDVLRRALTALKQGLPDTWRAWVDERPEAGSGGPDAFVTLTAPDGTHALLVVEAKRLLTTRDVPAVLEQLRRVTERSTEDPAIPMVVARHLAPSTRRRLAEEGAAFADATGNLRVALERPALFLRDVGADSDPWRGPGRPRGTLQGPPAARVVRALVDFSPPMTVPELVRRSGASTGATYRVIDFLEREALVERLPRGQIVEVQWRAVLERWSEDYGFQRSNSVVACLQPRGLDALLQGLRAANGLRYVLTGSLAAQHFAPYAPPRLAMIYVDDVDVAMARLDLRPVTAGANALLATGDYDVVYERSAVIDSVDVAAPSQIAVDLATGPGRSPPEAEALLDWMQAHEYEWRT